MNISKTHQYRKLEQLDEESQISLFILINEKSEEER
jgi:hypothetical protein